MKKAILIKNITDYIVTNRIKFVICFIFLVVGTVIGSLSAFFLDENSYGTLGNYMNNFTSANKKYYLPNNLPKKPVF